MGHSDLSAIPADQPAPVTTRAPRPGPSVNRSAMFTRSRRPQLGLSAAVATLSLLLVACGTDSEDPDPGTETEDGQDAVDSETGLPSEVAGDGDSAIVVEPDPDAPVADDYHVIVREDDLPRTQIAFREATATGDGMTFTLLIIWHPNNDDPVVEHDQFFVTSGEERFLAEGDGDLASAAEDDGERAAEVTVEVPGAPDNGAFYYQGSDYEAEETGLPPIGVCYQAGEGFDSESCVD